MKKATMIAAMLAAATLGASQYYSNITNQWYSGNQTNVYNEGMARLATNQNDIAGLLMVASWKLDFCEAAEIETPWRPSAVATVPNAPGLSASMNRR